MIQAHATELVCNKQSDLSKFQKCLVTNISWYFKLKVFQATLFNKRINVRRRRSRKRWNASRSHLLHQTLISSQAISYTNSSSKTMATSRSRIALHGNKDVQPSGLRADSATYLPTGSRIILSIARIFKWALVKIGFKRAFQQTGKAWRDVFVTPLYEACNRQFYWLLLSIAYGLVNPNAKWQKQIDKCLEHPGFQQLLYVPQLFYNQRNTDPVALLWRLFMMFLLTSETEAVNRIIQGIEAGYKLRTIVRGPGKFFFFSLQIEKKTVSTSRLVPNKTSRLLRLFWSARRDTGMAMIDWMPSSKKGLTLFTALFIGSVILLHPCASFTLAIYINEL